MTVVSLLKVGAFIIGLLCIRLLVADGLSFECPPVAVGLLIVDCLPWTYWAPGLRDLAKGGSVVAFVGGRMLHMPIVLCELIMNNDQHR